MGEKRVACINDISCFGKCSLTVALPIISALGAEAVPLPTGLLSTHTGGFEGYVCYDMTSQMKNIIAHWEALKLRFDGIYTGYFANVQQADIVREFIHSFKDENTQVIIDPVMADNGSMYSGFDERFINTMASLIREADIITPNITEALLLTGQPYSRMQSEKLLLDTEKRLIDMGAKRVVITGVSRCENKIGYRYFDEKESFTCEYDKLPGVFCGCGDVFASTLTAHVMNKESYSTAVKYAAEFAEKCILETAGQGDADKYGLCFEKCIKEGLLIRRR